jgi:uncharacterized protein (DUF58 family)
VKHVGRLRARPTAAFGGLLFVLCAMWYGASSQNNAAAYLLFFALGGVFMISIPHTQLNVARLKATAESIKPAFAGDDVSLAVEITNGSRIAAHGICVSAPSAGGDEERIDEIAAAKAARVILRFPAQSRGEHEIGHLCVASAYPLGFLRAVKRIDSSQRYLVYPKPAGNRSLPRERAHSRQNRPQTEFGEGDDFAGVRAYLPGESQRHIDWKAVARGQPLMTKRYTAETSRVLYLDFAAVPLNNTEARLAQLALWIIEAERARHSYGLRLPGIDVAPGLGAPHFHRCLRALALFR